MGNLLYFDPPASGFPPKVLSHFAGHKQGRAFFLKTGLMSLHY